MRFANSTKTLKRSSEAIVGSTWTAMVLKLAAAPDDLPRRWRSAAERPCPWRSENGRGRRPDHEIWQSLKLALPQEILVSALASLILRWDL